MVGRLFNREEKIKKTTLTRRTVLRNAAMTAGVPAGPFVRSSGAAATVVPKGRKMVLASNVLPVRAVPWGWMANSATR